MSMYSTYIAHTYTYRSTVLVDWTGAGAVNQTRRRGAPPQLPRVEFSCVRRSRSSVSASIRPPASSVESSTSTDDDDDDHHHHDHHLVHHHRRRPPSLFLLFPLRQFPLSSIPQSHSSCSSAAIAHPVQRPTLLRGPSRSLCESQPHAPDRRAIIRAQAKGAVTFDPIETRVWA